MKWGAAPGPCALLVPLAALACQQRERTPSGSQANPSPSAVASAEIALQPGPSARASTTAPEEAGERCKTVAAVAVQGLTEVKRIIEAAAAEADRSGGRARFGFLGPNDDGEGGFVTGIGIHTDERFDARVEYSVDREGRLKVLVPGSPLEVPDAILRSVSQACRRSPRNGE